MLDQPTSTFGGIRMNLRHGLQALLALSIYFSFDEGVWSQPPATNASRPVGFDPAGEPLPEGASARMGSTRWRIDGRLNSLRYAPDGKTLLVFANQGPVHCLDAGDGRALGRL